MKSRIVTAAIIFTLILGPLSVLITTANAHAYHMDSRLADADASFLGVAADDYSGFSIAPAGDVNNDGYDDFLVSAYRASDGVPASGKVYLFLGKASGWSQDVTLSNADASFTGEQVGDNAGYSIARAGDVNNDGYDDFLISAHLNDDSASNAGKVYLILGKASANWGQNFSLANADASFLGEGVNNYAGFSVSGAGDVNNDGYDDFLIGAYGNNEGGGAAGKAYLILGKATGWAKDQNLGTVGVAAASFRGATAGDQAGLAVSSAGNVNGDDYDDFLIGAPGRNGNTGEIYLIMGKDTGWTANQTLGPGVANASFIGDAVGNRLGMSIAAAGNVNGDNFDDFLIGSPYDDFTGVDAGQTYLILGRASGWSIGLGLDTANASFTGERAGDESGISVSAAGDINGDGYNDFLIGAHMNSDGGTNAGQTYVIMGNAAADWGKKYQLKNADASFLGENNGDKSGSAIAAAGDVNGDGGSDILIGAFNFVVSGKIAAGKTYLLFGNAFPGAPGSPQCQGMTNPTGLIEFTPRFSWIFTDADPGDSQSAYQVLVASSSANLAANNGDLWDSGKVLSTASSNIVYAGADLSTGDWGVTYYWKVRTWDFNGAMGIYSAEQTFAIQSAPTAPLSPLCEGKTSHKEVTDLTPDFSWVFTDPDDIDYQSAYRILVASSLDNLAAGTGDLWDSGKVESTTSGVTYSSVIALIKGETYFWKVKTWDSQDAEGPWSVEQTFTMAPAGFPLYAIILISAFGAAIVGALVTWGVMLSRGS